MVVYIIYNICNDDNELFNKYTNIFYLIVLINILLYF